MGDQKKETEYLVREINKAWERILKLETDFAKGPAQFAAESKEGSRKTSEYKNKAASTLSEAESSLKAIQDFESKISNIHSNTVAGWTALAEVKKETEEFKEYIDSFHERNTGIKEQIAQLDLTFQNLATYEVQLTRLKETATSAQSNLSRTNTIYNSILSKKEEIDAVYEEFLGWEEVDEETKEKKQIPGTKDEIEHNIENLKDTLISLESKTDEKLNWLDDETQSVIARNETNFDDLRKEISDTFAKVENRIRQLLPQALTAGLSHAYSQKKDDELKVLKNYEFKFQLGVFGLICVSVLPFLASIYEINSGSTYSEVLLRIPRLVFAIFPLYIPVLWIAYSNNRKANLAKRLIEEYTHKEVLSKTYEGLSSRIEEIEDDKNKEELRVKLLFNLLEVNSENPGKLITDYNKSDHPVMDALDKSIKLTNAVTKLSRIPGFNRLATYLEKRAEEDLKREEKKANDGFDIIDKEEKE